MPPEPRAPLQTAHPTIPGGMRAFGFCFDTLDPQNPDRLCRGRERWIDPVPSETEEPRIQRIVISGATFSDDSARDAERSLVHGGVTASAILNAVFGDTAVTAFAERGDPRALPLEMLLEEDWTFHPHGGLRQEPAVRWVAPMPLELADAWMLGERDGIAGPHAAGFLVGADFNEALVDALYELVGFSAPDGRPWLSYNAQAIPAVLEHCWALVTFHLDKHGHGLAIYTRERLDAADALSAIARAVDSFPVPFSIPPMLARWDRALYEQRADWDEAELGPYPVPPAEDAGGRWSSRRRPQSAGVEAVVDGAVNEEE